MMTESTFSFGLQEMPPQNVPVERLMVAMLPLDFSCYGLVTHSGEIQTNDKPHKKNSDGLLPTDDTEMKKCIRYYKIHDHK
jgi:hypothetical protein